MFYGVKQAFERSLGGEQADVVMAKVKTATTGDNAVWVASHKHDLLSSWADQAQDWQNVHLNGVNLADPYNLRWVNDFYDNWIKPRPQKQGFGGLCAGFNGSLSTTG